MPELKGWPGVWVDDIGMDGKAIYGKITDHSPRPSRSNCGVCHGRGLVQLRVDNPRLYGFQDYKKGLPPSMEEYRDFPCPNCSDVVPVERLEAVRAQSMGDFRYWQEPGYVEHIKHDLAHQLAKHLLDEGYIDFQHHDISKQIGLQTTATIGVVPKERILPVCEHLDQLHAKMTCMCGGPMNHSAMDEGHSPVSMFDYSLQNMEDENKKLKAKVAELENRFERVFP